MRYVLVSFAFLGWAFYELSGGADFEPRGLRSQKPEPVAAASGPAPAPPPRIESVAPAELVRRTAVKTTVAPRAAPEPALPEAAADAEIVTRLAQVGANFGAGISLAPPREGQALMLAALTGESAPQPSDSDDASQAAAAEPQPDIREITATRVNMRNGPGTNYPILTRLDMGHRVEILESSGTGWLRLRILPEQTMGWVAASLISKRAN